MSLPRLLVTVALAVVACAPQPASPSGSPAQSATSAARPVRGGTLTLVTDAQPGTYDAHNETTPSALDLLAPEYSLLYRYDEFDPQHLVPDLATGPVQYSSDKLTATVNIRDGVKFHDGGALTSADVLATYQKILDAGSARRAAYAMVDSVSAPDPTTVVFKLKNPSASFATLLASPWNLIYSAAKLKEDPHYYETHVDGTGPFVFVSNARDSDWVAKRNDAYYGKDAGGTALPYLDGIRYLILADPGARVDAIKTKKAAIDMRGVTPAQRDDIARAVPNDLALQQANASCVSALFPNVSKRPFDDVRVRRALSEAIDRRANNTALSAKANVNAVGAFTRPGSTTEMGDQDLQKVKGFGTDAAAAKDDAKKLLADARQSSLSLNLVTGATQIDDVLAAFVIDQWKQVGVTVTRVTLPSRGLAPQVDVELQTVCTYLDEPDLAFARFRGAYGDSKLDGLIDAQSKETDANKRVTAVGNLQRYVMDEKAYAFPVLWQVKTVPYLRTLRGWRIAPSDGNGEDLATAWLATS